MLHRMSREFASGSASEDLSQAFWFGGSDVYSRTLRVYGGKGLPLDTDWRTRQAADLMCGVAYSVRASMFESRKTNSVFPGASGFSDSAVSALTAIAVSVAIPAVVEWTGSKALITGASATIYRRELYSALRGAERNMWLAQGRPLDWKAILEHAARQFVDVAQGGRKRLRHNERELASVVFPAAITKARVHLSHKGRTMASLLAQLIGQAVPEHSPGPSTRSAERGEFGSRMLLDRTIDLMKLYRFRSFGTGERVAELDAAISDRGLDADWEDAYIRDIVSMSLGGSDGRDFSLADRLRLAGVFTTGARLGEHVLGQVLPVGRRSGEFDESLSAGRALQLAQYDEPQVIEFMRAVPEMTVWLVGAAVADAAALSDAGRIAFEQAAGPAMLAGVLWVAQNGRTAR